MGFWLLDAREGRVVGQFPHLFPASIAIGYGLFGLSGARMTVGVWAALGLLAVYFAGARFVGRAGGVRRRHTARGARHPGLVRAVSERRGRNAGAAVRGHPGIRARTPGRRPLLRTSRGRAARTAAVSPLRHAARHRRRLRRSRARVDRRPETAARGIPAAVRGSSRVELVLSDRTDARLLLAAACLPDESADRRRRSPRSRAARSCSACCSGRAGGSRIGRAGSFRRCSPSSSSRWRRTRGSCAHRRASSPTTTRTRSRRSRTSSCCGRVSSRPCSASSSSLRRDFWRDPALVLVFTAFSLFLFYKVKVVPNHFWMDRRFLAVILPGMLLFIGAAARRDVCRAAWFATLAPRRRRAPRFSRCSGRTISRPRRR